MKGFISPIATLLIAAYISGAAAEEETSSSLGQLAAALMTISKSIENPESLSEGDWSSQLKCTADMNSQNPTLVDENTCSTAKDADGMTCLWCDATATIGSGLCVSPSQKTMLGQYWDQVCAASDSSNNTPDEQPATPATEAATPNPTPAPTPAPTDPAVDPDDNVPDQLKCAMDGQTPITDETTCVAKADTSAGSTAGQNCVWCNIPLLGGQCITNSMHTTMSWMCRSEEAAKKEGNLRGDNNKGFKELDPSCLTDMDSCSTQTDSNGDACMWCDASGVFGICATPSQRDYMGGYMNCAEPSGAVVDESPMAVE